ncbi:DUF4230 domain-containing protein [Patescibacteria group bacterium]|jgi:hypothetical protein|nr:DUF4230 domain-containing protein [Patescibacteria group bacterium]
MQKKLIFSLVLALGILSSLIVGAIAGRLWFTPETSVRTVVSSQTILTALRDQGFLVTQTYVFDQPVTIRKTTGSIFQDFFVGQTIEARGSMEANLGLDLSKLSAEDVIATQTDIVVRVPSTTLFNTRLVGPIEVKNSQGLLKRVLEPDDGYNIALVELTAAAEAAARKPEIMDRATQKAVREIERLVGLLLQGDARTIKVEVKR